ncbi:hypothetical protein GYB61_08050 [bacterium]|nr:hypothetical protein [bacterium]
MSEFKGVGFRRSVIFGRPSRLFFIVTVVLLLGCENSTEKDRYHSKVKDSSALLSAALAQQLEPAGQNHDVDVSHLLRRSASICETVVVQRPSVYECNLNIGYAAYYLGEKARFLHNFRIGLQGYTDDHNAIHRYGPSDAERWINFFLAQQELVTNTDIDLVVGVVKKNNYEAHLSQWAIAGLFPIDDSRALQLHQLSELNNGKSKILDNGLCSGMARASMNADAQRCFESILDSYETSNREKEIINKKISEVRSRGNRSK